MTPRQLETLDFIAKYRADKRLMPTVREISEGLGGVGVSAVHARLWGLHDAGYIVRHIAKPRGIELTEKGKDIAGC